MKVELISAERLEPTHLEAWGEILRTQPTLDSPFFTPEFVQVVARVRQNVEVALLYDQERLAGFFPFQRTRLNVAVPVGAGFSEFQGVIAAPDLEWSTRELLEGCRVLAWEYDHVPVSQTPFAECHQRVGLSPYLDLSQGFNAYCDERKRRGSAVIRQTARKFRKLRRDFGEVTFELHDADPGSLEKLIEWKSAQHIRTGVMDVFQLAWVRELLRQVHVWQSTRYAGVMSVLSCDGRPIAVHLGMRTAGVVHLWYPAYDPGFAPYSPGIILFLEMARELAEQGVQRMDLGPTPQRYKQSLKSGDVAIGLGAADRYALARVGRHAWQIGREQLRASVLARPARIPVNWLKRMRQWQALR